MKDLYILDASGYLYRAYHAIQNMTNSKGESTNAIFGFVRSVLKLMKDFDPENFVCVFDGPKGSEKRKAIYPAYKATRKKMPDDLRYQIAWAREFCEAMGIASLNIPSVEADDTMGALAKWAESKKANSFICSSDKDLCQLVSDRVKILNTHKDNLILGKDQVEKVYGVPPEQIRDFLAITGDASDNVPGIPGFGPKTAISLLKELGSLQKILENPDKVPGKKKQETLKTEYDKAKISYELVTIDTSVEIPEEEEFYHIKSKDLDALKEFYARLNFTSLLKEIESQSQKNTAPEHVNYTLVDDENALKELIKTLTKAKTICFDTETTHLNPLLAELVGVGFCIDEGRAWYVPTNGHLGQEVVVKNLKPLFENPALSFIGHNAKYDWHVLQNCGISVANVGFDTILASYILDSHTRQHSLDNLALHHFGKVKIALHDLIGKGKKEISMRDVPIEKVCDYCCEDVDYTLRLKNVLEPELFSRKLDQLFFKLEMPLLIVLAKMERDGIFLDKDKLKGMASTVNDALKELEKKIWDLAGEEFNIKSPKQLGQILFEKLAIKPPKKTATGFSTDSEVLQILSKDYPIATKAQEYRILEKLRSTYIESLPLEINPKTHRIHPTFNQSVTATGRLSCQNPNLQNIPIRTELGKEIRGAFRPEKKGWSFLSADYSQIELRLLAHFSEDPKLIDAFENNEDIHAHTASTVLNIPLKDVTKKDRRRAKAVNFGILYGQQAFGLSKELGISMKEAQEFIQTYFERYSKVKGFLESCKQQARNSGRSHTLTGRERLIPEISSKNPMLRNAAERLAVNTPLQGTAADLIKMAMLQVDRQISSENLLSYMILQIHDELIFEVPDFEIIHLQALVKKEMEGVLKLKVPLVVDIEIGKNWKEC